MSKGNAKVSVDLEMMKRFWVYHSQHPGSGPLHIWLEDDNVETHHIEFCLERAILEENIEAAELAKLGIQMSRTQRLKVSRGIYDMPMYGP